MQIAICPNCNINTAGNHAWNCPFNPNYNSSNTMIYNQPNNILTSPKNIKEETKQKQGECRHLFVISLIDTEPVDQGAGSTGYFYRRIAYVVCEKCGEVKTQLI